MRRAWHFSSFLFLSKYGKQTAFSYHLIFRSSQEDLPLGEFKLSRALMDRLDFVGLQSLGSALVHRNIRSVKSLFCLTDDEKEALVLNELSLLLLLLDEHCMTLRIYKIKLADCGRPSTEARALFPSFLINFWILL